MILVTGATGKVGGEAARLLAARQQPVRAFVRSADRAAELRSAGAEIAVGVFDDSGSLDAALSGVDTLVLVSPGNPVQEQSAIDAAVRAGVGHVVYITSKASLDAPIERRRWHAQTEAHLLASGMGYTLLRANGFLQNTLNFAPVVAANGGFSSSAGEGRMGLVDSRDVAASAAAVAADPGRHKGATYWLSGPASITYTEVAATLTDLLGVPVTYTVVSPDDERDALIARGVPEAVAVMNAQAFALNAAGDADWVSDDVKALTGREPRSFRDFATDHLSAFRA